MTERRTARIGVICALVVILAQLIVASASVAIVVAPVRPKAETMSTR